ncbi:MAG: LysR family transcriptional regulator [Spirochaetaceae bacterium]|jgi:molybdate transport system regulatory protein|nr:LysR family transcriptional regulator [Spirochaetaceae bacterium]
MVNAQFKPVTKVFLAVPGGCGKPFYGPGMLRLLDAIDKEGTVLKACKTMGLSYSKGWKLLKMAEQCAGFPVIARRQGGKGGGCARLTDEGKAFIEKYRQFEAESRANVEGVFNKYWPRESAG